MAQAGQRAAVLVEALPWMRRFQGAVVVIKQGGASVAGGAPLSDFAEDVVLLASVGLRPVVVHGGGPQIGEWMRRLGKEAVFVDGMRVTDSDTLDIARMVLVGKVNRDLVGAINTHGPIAVGLSGEDAGLIRASAHPGDLGFVGQVEAVDPAILRRLLAQGLIPVVATIGSDDSGQAYNINADLVAGAIATSLSADKLVFLTDVEGVRADPADPGSVMQRCSPAQIEAMVANGTVLGGMVPKVTAAVHAVTHGVGSVHIVDGRLPRALLLEVFTDEGVGTMIAEHGATPPSTHVGSSRDVDRPRSGEATS